MSNTKLIDRFTWDEIVDKVMLESKLSTPDFKKWLQSKKNLKGTFFNSKYWRNAFAIQKKINNKDDDHVEVIVGKEGSGKSTLAIQKCCVVDPTFSRDRIFNSPLELFTWLKDNKGNTKGKAILLDEGNLFLFSREAMKQGNVSMIKLFALMRQANLYICICIPYYDTIDSYIRKHRIDSLTVITRSQKTFCYYNSDGIKVINDALKKGIPIGKIKVPSGKFFEGYWNGDLPCQNDINKENYLQIKDKAWDEFLDNSIDSLETKGSAFISTKEAAKITGVSQTHIQALAKEGKIAAKLLGKKYVINKEDFLGDLGYKGTLKDDILLKGLGRG